MALWTRLKRAMGLFGDPKAELALPVRQMLTGLYPGATGNPPTRGTQQRLAAYADYPWLQAVAAKVAQSIAAVEWELYVVRSRRTGQVVRDRRLQRADAVTRKALLADRRGVEELEAVEDHLLLDALDGRFCPFMTGLTLRQLTQLYLDIEGESFWLKERNRAGAPVAFWPIPPHWIQDTPTVIKRTYQVSYRGWQGEIPDTEILCMTQPNPENPYARGVGRGRALADEMETDEYSAKMVRQFFFNGARPDFMVFPKNGGEMTETEVQRVERDWLSRNQGFWRAFKPYFLRGEIGVHEFRKDFRELQLVELRQFERDTIIQAFGISPEMLGIVAGADRAHAEAAEFQFTKHALVPRLEFLRANLQEKLIPEYDEALVLDYVSPVTEDREYQLRAASAQPHVLTVDEWRALTGHTALEDGGGEVHAVPLSLTFMESLVETPMPEPTAPIPPEAPLPAAFGLPAAGVTST